MSFSIQFGNFLYRRAYWLYRPLYAVFKRKQDAYEIELLKKYIRKNDVVLDIGANIGFYATVLSDLVGTHGEVHCFEPDVKNFLHLQHTIAGMKNITINNKAVGPKTEKLKMYTSKNLNVDHRTYKPDDYEAEFDIDAVSIDDYLRADKTQPAKKVHFIKMDIQGFEMQAIKGMQETLRENKTLTIISEFWPYGLRKAGSSITEYFDFLSKEGFTCSLLKKNHLQKLNSQQVALLADLGEDQYFNILAIRENV